ncbi:phage tail assembly protein [Photobacterium damselae]|uniref:phage tail assembly protein n=1 Tax=Photobacterium damselae TaxID=38293 RepID=UPI001EFC48E3|nr:phage tail assembly protein [Photobacterium damselae]MCG9780416.1 phage tail assembly protein [Photobacterium damselae]
MSNNKTVKLNQPIKRGEEEITEITLREPKSGELRGLELFSVLRMDVTAHRTLIPRISNVTANEFDQFGPKDLAIVTNEVVSFFME